MDYRHEPLDLIARAEMASRKMNMIETAKELGITRVTLKLWMLNKPPKIQFRSVTVGPKTFYIFDPNEVARIKSKIKRKREPGKSVLKDPIA